MVLLSGVILQLCNFIELEERRFPQKCLGWKLHNRTERATTTYICRSEHPLALRAELDGNTRECRVELRHSPLVVGRIDAAGRILRWR